MNAAYFTIGFLSCAGCIGLLIVLMRVREAMKDTRCDDTDRLGEAGPLDRL